MDTSIVCIACGEVSNRASDRRNLTSQASQHVVSLFTEMFGEECRKQGKAIDLDILLADKKGYKYVPEVFLRI